MRKLIELVDTLDRDTDQGTRDPPLRPRGEGEGPRDGVYWLHDQSLVPITGKANEIVALSGQVVMLDPEKFGLTSDAIMRALKPYGSGKYSPEDEYQQYLDGTEYDLSHYAVLWKSSRIVYQMMLRAGWAWVKDNAPEAIQFAVMPNAAKQQLSAAADYFPLMQIDHIHVTLMTNFESVSDRFPHVSKNKTLSFGKGDFKGFAGTFGAAMDWAGGGEAPSSNYLYFLTREPASELTAAPRSVKTEKGYRRRYAITFYANPPPSSGGLVARVPMSVFNKIDSHRHWERGLTPVSAKGTRTMFSDRYFAIQPADIDVQRDGKWQPASRGNQR